MAGREVPTDRARPHDVGGASGGAAAPPDRVPRRHRARWRRRVRSSIPKILNWLTGPYRDVCRKHLTCPGKLVITDPLEGFAVRMKVAGYGGIVLAIPVVLWQIWRFITPGLTRTRSATRSRSSSRRRPVPLRRADRVWTFPKALEFLIRIGGDDLQQLFSPSKYFDPHQLDDAGLRHRLRVPGPARLPRARRRADAASSSRAPAQRSSASSSSPR